MSTILPVIRFSYGIILAMLLSKNLSVSEYGEWSFFISMLGLVLTFSSLSLMYSSQVIFPTKNKLEIIADLNSIAFFKVIFTILIAFLFAIYGYLFELFSFELSVLFCIVVVFRSIADLVYGLLRALLKIKEQIFFLFFESILVVGLVGYVLLVRYGNVYESLYVFLYAEVIASIYGLYLLRDYIKLKKIDLTLLGPYLKIGIPLVPFAFMDLIINSTTPLFIKLYDSLEAVALYSISQKVAMLMVIPSSVLGNVYVQYLSKAHQKSKGEMLSVLNRFLFLYSVSTLLMLIFLYIFGLDIILLISSVEYTSAYDILLLLLFANIFVIFSSIFTSVFAVLKQVRKVSYVWIGVLFLYVILSMILSKYYMFYGAIYAILISFGIGFVIISYLVFREFRT
jgi:O-antigen/teichoic acid export membrane protein